MTNRSTAVGWRGTIAGLAPLLVFNASADESTEDFNFVLIEDHAQPEESRLLIFDNDKNETEDSAGSDDSSRDEIRTALVMLAEDDAKRRIRGLTLLSDVDDSAVLHAAMDMVNDPDAAVREEAIHLAMHHPLANYNLVAQIGLSDPSQRVRQMAADLLDETQDE